VIEKNDVITGMNSEKKEVNLRWVGSRSVLSRLKMKENYNNHV